MLKIRWLSILPLFSLGLIFIQASAVLADSTARADTGRSVLWNLWNNTDSDTRRWIFNPGGSTYVLQADAVAPGGPLVPPAVPFPVGAGVGSVPGVPPGFTKFVEAPVGTAVAGKATWGTVTVPATAPSLSNAIGNATGSSSNGIFFWSATGNTDATGFASAATGRTASWGKVFDPWTFHDFEPEEDPGTLDFLTLTAALTINPILEVDASERGNSAHAISETSIDIEGINVATLDIMLWEKEGIVSFDSNIIFNDATRLYSFFFDDEDEVVIGSLLDKNEFVNMVNGFFDPESGTWNPPDEGINLMIAYDLPQTVSFFLNNEGEIEAVFEGADIQDTIAATVPEPTSTLSLLALGTLGAASTLKRKLKPSTEKEVEKLF